MTKVCYIDFEHEEMQGFRNFPTVNVNRVVQSVKDILASDGSPSTMLFLIRVIRITSLMACSQDFVHTYLPSLLEQRKVRLID